MIPITILILFFFISLFTYSQSIDASALIDWDDTAEEVGQVITAFNDRTITYLVNGGNQGGYVKVYGHPSVGIENSESGFTGNYVQKGCNL